jgi:hypothetical protein
LEIVKEQEQAFVKKGEAITPFRLISSIAKAIECLRLSGDRSSE